MSKHRKADFFKVALNKDDAAALRELARREGALRKDPELGAATLLRELAMPHVHTRLAELKAESVRSDEDRRSGEERRAPAGAART